MDVGRALYSVAKGGPEGLDLWVQYSEKADVKGRSREDCLSHYYTFRGSGVTIKTLGWFAREDNPDHYNEWHRAWINDSLTDALSTTDADVAEAFYRCSGYSSCTQRKARNGTTSIDIVSGRLLTLMN